MLATIHLIAPPDSSMLFSIRSIAAEQTLPLRQALLLDGTSDPCRFQGDDDESTLHLAVLQEHRIVAVATILREAQPESDCDAAWRLRGIAVEPHVQGYGFGRRLIGLCLKHAQRRGARLVWCTARESARGFYEALGFTSSAPPFKLPSRGDLSFYTMHCVLPGGSTSDVEQESRR